MNRTLHYPLAQTTAYIYDKYENIRESFVLANGTNELAILPNGLHYGTKEGQRFYIYDGIGQLSFEDCLEQYDFSYTNESFVWLLDFYLQQGFYAQNTTPKDKKRIDDFIKVYDKNIAKESFYLKPKGFERLEKILAEGKK